MKAESWKFILAGYTTLREQNFVTVFLLNGPVPTNPSSELSCFTARRFFFHTATLTALSTSLVLVCLDLIPFTHFRTFRVTPSRTLRITSV